MSDQYEACKPRMAELERELKATNMVKVREPLDAALVMVIRLRAQLTTCAAAITALAHPTDPQHEPYRKITAIAHAVLEETKGT